MTPEASNVFGKPFNSISKKISHSWPWSTNNLTYLLKKGLEVLKQPASKPSEMTPKADHVSLESISDWIL